MEFKVMEKPDMTEEELRYFNEHSFAEEFRKGLEDGTAIVSNGPWEETVKEIKARKAREATKMASFRLPTWVIEGLKRNAAKGGVKYSEYAIEVLSKAAI
jgi:predicted DNA binding CopG/RHH family protein